ncbi:2-oxoacid dehydrogenase acyltransferase, catalytic domain-containing protein [Cynara cardunculus var. scolymus]|uniref:dihydrolipoyllysine-residue succinyltransferase n=1 Tax=Cynara cardunculus var. scolymus TaxID=59895 RepID=A0A124SHR0_CYNCS|nr:2-oxoacid dehydrogenase acyltransferase, catalytic domain-containing protein [Cynara cardunculus var. scolymus]
MFGALRRKVVSGSCSASIVGKSCRKLRPVASTVIPPFTSGEEILLHRRTIGNCPSICHLMQPGNAVNTRPISEGDLVDVVVPFMGESISDGTLATFLKKVGDRVEVDEPIAQVETDKVTIDVASPEAGIIQESAILGTHSIMNKPMVVGGNIVPRPMMYIALTYDHRLIDGREAVFFLRRIKDVVEEPRRLLLDI